uniref:Interleukin-5 n=1 Tax=Melopsittacus undulatus TaxID=13146 RepID=A0A8C6N8H6_MELUD
MKTYLYLLLMVAGICAAPHMSSITELLTLLQQMRESMSMVTNPCISPLLFLPSQDVNCISTVFEGIEQLKTNAAMKKFSEFFWKFERLKQSLTPSLGREEKCDTERKSATVFMGNLVTFIRKAALRSARA